MTSKDCLFWKKDDVGITRAPDQLNDRQTSRAEMTLAVATMRVKGRKSRKSG
jgi:hypothetical protein